MTTKVTAHRLRLASPAIATVLGALVLALAVTEVALSFLTRNFVFSDGGAGPAALLVYAAVGVVVARRQPRNPIGWILAAVALIGTVSQDIKLYVVLDYRLHHGALPLGPVAASLTKTGTLAELLVPLAILLFPDGRLPSRRWRWTLWVWLAGGSLSVVAAFAAEINGISGQQVRVSASGQLENTPAGIGVPLATAAFLFVLVSVLICLSWVARQFLSYRRSAGERRQQLKWLVSGAAVLVVCLVVLAVASDQAVRDVAFLGVAALPVGMGVGILKYHLYDIDRIISRTLAYALVTGLLVGVYAGLVLLTTQVFRIHTPVAVAASTLAAAALFNPLRRRVQQAVDRRFNRARYDADQTVTAFAARLKNAVDLDAVRDDLAGVVHQALEPAHVSVWISQRD